MRNLRIVPILRQPPGGKKPAGLASAYPHGGCRVSDKPTSVLKTGQFLILHRRALLSKPFNCATWLQGEPGTEIARYLSMKEKTGWCTDSARHVEDIIPSSSSYPVAVGVSSTATAPLPAADEEGFENSYGFLTRYLPTRAERCTFGWGKQPGHFFPVFCNGKSLALLVKTSQDLGINPGRAS